MKFTSARATQAKAEKTVKAVASLSMVFFIIWLLRI